MLHVGGYFYYMRGFGWLLLHIKLHAGILVTCCQVTSRDAVSICNMLADSLLELVVKW